MPSCTLEIADRIVARAEGGTFDAEYALFEAHEIELRSNNEPGTVREHGYRTTVELARERLDADGATPALAKEAAEELGALATAYAFGPEVRRVLTLLTAAQLFEGRVWQAAAREYEGAWLDVAALAEDLGLDGAAHALQALYLATLLADAPPDATVYLSTTEYTADRRPGERTHRRVSLASARLIPNAIRALAEGATSAPRSPRGGPSRFDLLDSVRVRLPGTGASLRPGLEAIARALSVRDRPQRGPLADPDLWALEQQLGAGDPRNVVERIDAIERARGRQPATAYLRARVALLDESEDPAQIAERVSALALSMNAFAELELLAAEAWARAGDRKRALAYAHDLAENPQVDPDIQGRARAIASSALQGPVSSGVPLLLASVPPSESSPIVAITAGRRTTLAFERVAPPSAAPPRNASIAPSPIVSVGIEALRRASTPPDRSPERPLGPPSARLSSATLVAAQRASQPSMRAVSGALPAIAPVEPNVPIVHEKRPSVRPSMDRADDDEDDEDDDGGGTLVRGGSQPPFRSDPPPVNFPPTPLVPRLDPERVEKVETLSLPPGLDQEALPEEVPSNPLEARIYFTRLARELARLYRQRYGVELRTNLRSVELVQRYLSERFASGGPKTDEDVRELRLHGAFLSELLARRLGAEWTDLAVSEMGYWAMNVPSGRETENGPPLSPASDPAGTTIWPIGRVIRFVTMQHKERDLVSYFLELQARVHGLK